MHIRYAWRKLHYETGMEFCHIQISVNFALFSNFIRHFNSCIHTDIRNIFNNDKDDNHDDHDDDNDDDDHDDRDNHHDYDGHIRI